jgi:hypothetical protein
MYAETLNESSIDRRESESFHENQASFTRMKFSAMEKSAKGRNDKLERYRKEVDLLKKQIIELRSENKHQKTQLNLNPEFRATSLNEIYENIQSSKRDLKKRDCIDKASDEFLNQIRQLKFRVSGLERDNRNLEIDLEAGKKVEQELVRTKKQLSELTSSMSQQPLSSRNDKLLSSFNLEELFIQSPELKKNKSFVAKFNLGDGGNMITPVKMPAHEAILVFQKEIKEYEALIEQKNAEVLDLKKKNKSYMMRITSLERVNRQTANVEKRQNFL